MFKVKDGAAWFSEECNCIPSSDNDGSQGRVGVEE